MLLSTEESIKMPCSVKAYGEYLLPPLFEVPIWHLKNSSFVKRNIKSSGNLSMFLRTCRVSCFVSTPYNAARSLSSITFLPLISNILPSIVSCGTKLFFVFSCFMPLAFHYISFFLPINNNKYTFLIVNRARVGTK